ncbi:MAG: C69 family dipeptidase [Oscillospiraceae bacterium]|nr:C69 family dipeptidase [Oscillospiraceae bacterium]
MSCTTVLVGSKASNDRSTMIARTDDGHFDVKKLCVVTPKQQKRRYKSVLSHVEIELPDDPLSYTACPSVDLSKGIWAATGINAAGVGMTATETITSNPRVLSADPLVELKKAKGRGEKEIPGGIGEEDIVVLVLPYIRSAREGVLRLASLLERYGTYESNGIAFNDEREIWWMETIGGHHWMARRVPDEAVVIMPNQFGMDAFDLDDAFGAQKAHLCSADLREFITGNDLDLNQNGAFNPRAVFGSRTDNDHVYNTPRAWYMGRTLCPRRYRWDGPDADFTPESDDIPWSFVPERKLAVEDVKALLSSNYQGTPYNPYLNHDTGLRGKYRSIGINRTGVTSVCQIRPDRPDPIKGVEWVCFASTTFNALLPVYTNVDRIPGYLSAVTTDCSTENFFWASALIGALADHSYSQCVQHIDRYQAAVLTKGRRILREYDRRMTESGDFTLSGDANEALAKMAREETTAALNKVLLASAETMKNGYNRADN